MLSFSTKINESLNKLLEIDFSVFYREGLYNEHKSGIKKEYVMEEVFPDFIVFPGIWKQRSNVAGT